MDKLPESLSNQVQSMSAAKKVTLGCGMSVILVPMLCCCCLFSWAIADSSLRSAGILPTNTPTPANTATSEITLKSNSTTNDVTQSPLATPTLPLTDTPLPTSAPRPTNTSQPTDTATPTNTPRPTNTARPTATKTPTRTPTPATPMIVVVSSQLNVRSGPGTNYPVIQTLEQGDEARATGFNAEQTWVQIRLSNNVTGWVGAGEEWVTIENANSLSTVTNIPPPPQPTTPPQPTQAPPTQTPEPTQVVQQPTAPPPPPQNCDPSYPTVCIPSPPPDLNCGDIPFRRFTVLEPDPHGFDRDNDGIGCESG